MATFFARFLLPFGRPRGRLPDDGLEDSVGDSTPLRFAREFSVPFIRRSNRYLRLASVTRSESMNWDACGKGPCAIRTVISFLRESLADWAREVGLIRP